MDTEAPAVPRAQLDDAPFAIDEFARRTGLTVDWIRHHMDQVPHHRPSPGRVVFTQQDVVEYLASVRKVPADAMRTTARARSRRRSTGRA